MKKIRLRYAPSPTGKLHIGGARTALFNFLLAKKLGGEFLIRIEDTDISRNQSDGEKNQIENLEWMGIIADHKPGKEDETGPFRQSERLEIYKKYANELLEKGLAYKCCCSPEELQEYRESEKAKGNPSPKYSGKCASSSMTCENPSIRIRMPEDQDFSWIDGVRGEIIINSKDVGDWVIMKSNGIPTYSFANVIDDGLMNITHVLRGEEHISNTPKQIHLYELLGFEKPEFSHLTIITNMEGKKLSKRDETIEQFMEQFISKGYLPEAIFNFMSLLGWSPKTEEEVFTKDELISKFNIEGFSKSSTKFDVEKMKWYNNLYIKELTYEKLEEFLNPFVKEFNFEENFKKEILQLFQPQLHEGIEITELVKLFVNDYKISQEDNLWLKENLEILKLMFKDLTNLEEWKAPNIKELLMKNGAQLEIKGRALMMPLRLSITGVTQTPEISKVIELFGKEKTLNRLERFVNE